MVDKIKNEAQYNEVTALIEKFISKATEGGGFNSLSATEAEELSHLSLLVELYEDNVLNIMPLKKMY